MAITFDPAPAAKLLIGSMNSVERLREIPEAARPGSISEGYDVQDHIATSGSGLNDKTAGWKLGLGSPNAMKGAKLDRPLIGRVFKNRLHANPAAVSGPDGASAMIEIELAFTLARDIGPAEPAPQPLDIIARANLVSEVVLSRFIDRTVVGLPSFTADNVGFHALIIGPEVDPSRISEIAKSVSVTRDGEHVAGSLSGDDAIDPLAMVPHLLAHARDRGITLTKGEIITTGTLSKPFDVIIPSTIEARTSDGTVSYKLTSP